MSFKLYFVSTVAALFVIGCSNNINQPDGGPCSYDITAFPGEIVQIDTGGTCEIYFAVNHPSFGSDTMTYSVMTGSYPSCSIIDSLGLVPGVKMKCEYMKIKTGHCTPEIVTVQDEIWK